MAKKPKTPAAQPAPPAPPGRPTKCTPETVEVILVAIRKGHYVETATRLAKIDDKTYYSWKQRGETGEEPFAAFLHAVKEADAEAQDSYLDTVRIGGTGPNAVHWTSAMTFMERRWPSLYAKRGPDGDLDKRLRQLEIDTAEAKLKILSTGVDPDAQSTITVIVPTYGDDS